MTTGLNNPTRTAVHPLTGFVSSVRLGELLIFCVGFVAFLPFLKTSPLGSDVQPHYFAVFPATLLIFHERLKHSAIGLVYLGCLLFIGISYLQMSAVEIIGFATMGTSVLLMCNLDERQKVILAWAVRAAMLVYVMGVVFDLVGLDAILDATVSNRRGHSGRGSTSFASEPSFLGFAGLAGYVVLLRCDGKYKLFDRLVPCLVLFASGSVAAIIPGFFVLAAANLRSLRSLFVTAILFAGLIVFSFVFFQNSRFVELSTEIWRNPVSAMESSSGANRLFRGFGPSWYGLNDGFMPHQTSQLEEIYRDMAFLREDVRITRVSNVAGQMFFVFGLLSFPLLGLYLFQFRRLSGFHILLAFFTVGTFCFSLVSCSTPYMHWTLASLLWPSKRFVDQQYYEQPGNVFEE